MDYEIDYKDIGIIRFIKNNRAKRIIISIKPEFVRVTIPRRHTLKDAQKFVKQKIDWIKIHSNNMKTLLLKSKKLPKIDKEEAREKLGKRLSELAQKYDFKYNKLYFDEGFLLSLRVFKLISIYSIPLGLIIKFIPMLKKRDR